MGLRRTPALCPLKVSSQGPHRKSFDGSGMSRQWRRFTNWFQRHTRRNSILLGVVVILLAAGAWGIQAKTSSDTGTVTRNSEVTTGTMQETVTGSGTVAASSTNDLNFETSGQISSVNVEAGEKVGKNQVLARINSASLRAQVAQARSSVASAQSKLSSDQDADASSAQISADQASLESAQAELAAAEDSLRSATLRSPIAGTVSAVNLSVGQYVTAGSSTAGSGTTAASSGAGATSSDSTSTPQVQVISTGSYVVNLNVDDTQISKLSKGDQATITLTGTSDKIFGTVTSVGLVAQTSSGVSTFPVEVKVTGSPADVYPGTAAEVAIVYRQLNDVLQVPTQAISRNGDKQTVQVVTGTGSETREITTGISSGGQTQVLTGLTSGEQVQITTRTIFPGVQPGGSSGSGDMPSGGFPAGGVPGGGSGPPAGFSGGGLAR